MTWAQKKLRVTITLESGQFAGGGNSLVIENMRVSAHGTIAPGAGQSVLEELAIYGLTLSQMNQLTVTGANFAAGQSKQKNTVLLEAGDDQVGMNAVFYGYILYVFPDLNNMPQGCFRIANANCIAYPSKMKVAPTSQKGSVNAATLLQGLAGQIGLQFENSGVKTMLSNPYLHGSPIAQIKQCAEARGCEWLITSDKKLAVWPSGKSRTSSSIPVIQSPGMVGFPHFQMNYVDVLHQYDPTIECGKPVQIKSKLTAACGKFIVNQMAFDLESMVPHGHWFLDLKCTPDDGGYTAAGNG